MGKCKHGNYIEQLVNYMFVCSWTSIRLCYQLFNSFHVYIYPLNYVSPHVSFIPSAHILILHPNSPWGIYVFFKCSSFAMESPKTMQTLVQSRLTTIATCQSGRSILYTEKQLGLLEASFILYMYYASVNVEV